MLKRAAAAQPEVRAARHDAIGSGLEHFEQRGIVMLLVTSRTAEANALARQRARDERGLALANDAFTFMRDRGDNTSFFRLRNQVARRFRCAAHVVNTFSPAFPTHAGT